MFYIKSSTVNSYLTYGGGKLKGGPPGPAPHLRSTQGKRAYGQPKRKMCTHVNPTTNIIGPKSVFQIRRGLTSKLKSLVYTITCPLCSDTTTMLSVGETCCTLALRAEEHLQTAMRGYNNQVGEHFQQPGHCAEHFSICGVWQKTSG